MGVPIGGECVAVMKGRSLDFVRDDIGRSAGYAATTARFSRDPTSALNASKSAMGFAM
jgi:hypothetical protein